jgi:hypothetical protein
MICHLDKDKFDSYPEDFPKSIDLKGSIDPFTQHSLYELSQRAFGVRMPYFAFCVAQFENGCYRPYDAILYRLGKYNQIPNHDLDPFSRSRIKNVFYFALSNPLSSSKSDGQNEGQEVKASIYPSPAYASLRNIEGFSQDKIERYAFSALNYYVIEKGEADDLKRLLKMHKVLKSLLESASRDANDTSLKELWLNEIEKWKRVQFKNVQFTNFEIELPV